ncbi:MAG: peptidylprolyl isomerase [Ignavibacteria bacterium]|nr:peptidylprolyl isomerase [Ignavibacteria bacterium]
MKIALCALMMIVTCTSVFAQTSPAPKSIVSPVPSPVVTEKVILETSKGTIVIGLYGKDAPKTVANFSGLAAKNFFKDILFHRIVPGFVIQAGDPKTKDESLKSQWGQGGESIYNGQFADELNPETPSYKVGYARGVVAMANAGPNTNTSQFFVCLGDLGLPKAYTMFGKVLKGMEVVDSIAAVPNTGSVPNIPIKILSSKVEKVKK